MIDVERPEEMLTKYERARLIGARALQISQGAPILVELSEEELRKVKFNPVEIAKLEFSQGKIPLAIKRATPEQAQPPQE